MKFLAIYLHVIVVRMLLYMGYYQCASKGEEHRGLACLGSSSSTSAALAASKSA